MRYAKFSIALFPTLHSPFAVGNDAASVEKLAREIMAEWPVFQPDAIETARSFPPLEEGVVLLAAKTAEGLIQLKAQLERSDSDEMMIWLSLAYCNPRSADELFCSIAERLMQKYELYCFVYANLPPELGDEKYAYASDALRGVVLPTIEYNRGFWQSDAGTTETAILRAGDAVERFIVPQLVSVSANQEAQLVWAK